MKRNLVRRGGLLTLVVAGAVLAGAVPASAAPGDGSAYAIDVNVKLLTANAVDVGPLAASSTSGPTSNNLINATVPGIITAGAITTSAIRDPNSGAVTSKAAVAGVGLPLLSAALPGAGVEAVEAVCTATQAGITGSTKLVGAKLGAAVDASPAPNTQIKVQLGPVHVATVTLNEQIKNQDGSLTVNAIHVKLLGGILGAIGSGDVVISSATCGPAAPPIPLASGIGLWLSLGLLGVLAVPAGFWFVRNRRLATTA